MTIAQVGKSGKIEITNKNEVIIHYGYLSIRMNKEDLEAFNKVFALGADHPEHENLSCSLIEMKNGHYIVVYRGLTFALCENALKNFRILIHRGTDKYNELFNVEKRESKEDIEMILNTVEQKIMKGEK